MAALTNIPTVNKTDVQTLSASFPTVADIFNADEASLKDCPGLGPKKIASILGVLDATLNSDVFSSS